ncbi:MAG: flagellar M-ring protein FliF [Clostridiales bacterium]|jgi:flagellar M-ring protein FliF|nr:flagellar M-ring protein FliF [Clostridiales bacterium]MDK2932279.1 flagellar M-ring protein FliF [Clostridiales bacterium]
MPELFNKIPQQIMDFWNNLSKNNKYKIIITTVIVFLSIVIAVITVTRPQYQSLFTHLDPKDIGEVSKQLEKLNIDYKLDDNGTSIKVKKQDLNKAKVSLAEAGYPKRGMTFEDLTKTSLGTTDAERRKRYQIYKESDLAAALEEMDNVKSAIVKLTIPDKTAFFNDEENAAKAGVIVESYDQLTGNQIKAIQRFIAGSVENLDPKDVTILDHNGNMLNEDYDNNLNGNVDKQYALKQLVKRNVEKQVQQLLAGTADNVRVMANLELDFNTLVTNKEIYEPVIDGKGVIRSFTERKESSINSETGGVPGTDANPPTYPNALAGTTGESKLSDQTINYEINKTVTQATKEIGKVDKENSSITVAMFYNVPSSTQPGNGSDAANVTQARADINQIKAMVASATGIPVENVTVQSLEIAPAVEEKPKPSFLELLDIYGPIVLLVLLMGLIALAILRRKSEQDANQQPQSNTAYNIPAQEEMLPEIDLEERSEVKKQIEKFVKQKPEAVAQLLRNWLAEDWD